MSTDQILAQLGQCVLLAIFPGEKGPRRRGWQKLTHAEMTRAYLAGLNHGQNTGVLLRSASEGLCTIDVDNDDPLGEFLSLNPRLRQSLISRGSRGGNIWLRIKGPYPQNGKIKTLQGGVFGEWRAGWPPEGSWMPRLNPARTKAEFDLGKYNSKGKRSFGRTNVCFAGRCCRRHAITTSGCRAYEAS